MNTMKSSADINNEPSRPSLKKQQVLRIIQTLSHLVTLVFLVTLIVAIYQAIINRNPLPIWAWLGMTVLLATVIGLGVAVVVYQGVAKQAGPFDFRPSAHVAGELKSEVRQVGVDGANSLQVNINMKLGVLQMMGGSMDAVDASFTYDNADWNPPLVDYVVGAGGEGKLTIEQITTGRPAMRQGRSEWMVRLNQDLPTDLNVKFGAGKAAFNLGGMAIDRLRIESGVGELDIDLRAEWKRSLQAFIKAGIGDTTLRLPQNAGVRVQTTVGLGSVQPNGLTWDGEAYTNALYGHSEVNLDIALDGSMGKVKLGVESKREGEE